MTTEKVELLIYIRSSLDTPTMQREIPIVYHRLAKMERHLTGEINPTAKNLRSFIEHLMVAKVALKVVAAVGVSMVMAGEFPVSFMRLYISVLIHLASPKELSLTGLHRRGSHSCAAPTWCYPRP
jgi:hypothetical protein